MDKVACAEAVEAGVGLGIFWLEPLEVAGLESFWLGWGGFGCYGILRLINHKITSFLDQRPLHFFVFLNVSGELGQFNFRNSCTFYWGALFHPLPLTVVEKGNRGLPIDKVTDYGASRRKIRLVDRIVYGPQGLNTRPLQYSLIGHVFKIDDFGTDHDLRRNLISVLD